MTTRAPLRRRGSSGLAERRGVRDDGRQAREEQDLRRPLAGHFERLLLSVRERGRPGLPGRIQEGRPDPRRREGDAADVDPRGGDLLQALAPEPVVREHRRQPHAQPFAGQREGHVHGAPSGTQAEPASRRIVRELPLRLARTDHVEPLEPPRLREHPRRGVHPIEITSGRGGARKDRPARGSAAGVAFARERRRGRGSRDRRARGPHHAPGQAVLLARGEAHEARPRALLPLGRARARSPGFATGRSCSSASSTAPRASRSIRSARPTSARRGCGR